MKKKEKWQHALFVAITLPFELFLNLMDFLLTTIKKLKCEKICFFISGAMSILALAFLAFAIFKDASAMTKIIAMIAGGIIWLFSTNRMRRWIMNVSIADPNDLPRWKKILQKILFIF